MGAAQAESPAGPGHFIVFERRDDGVVKRICSYQHFRVVNGIVRRVVEEELRRGLVRHTSRRASR